MLLGDLVWPALLLEGRLLTWWAIIAGLVVEFVVLRFWIGMSTRMAILADLVMNGVSTVAGIVLIPLAGVLWEIIPGYVLYSVYNISSFNPITWTATCVLAALINALLEGLVLRLAFQIRFSRKVFVALLFANAVSVGLAYGSLFVMQLER